MKPDEEAAATVVSKVNNFDIQKKAEQKRKNADLKRRVFQLAQQAGDHIEQAYQDKKRAGS